NREGYIHRPKLPPGLRQDIETGLDGLTVDDDVEETLARRRKHVLIKFEIHRIASIGYGEGVRQRRGAARMGTLVKRWISRSGHCIRSKNGSGAAASEVAIGAPDIAHSICVGPSARIYTDGRERRWRPNDGKRDGITDAVASAHHDAVRARNCGSGDRESGG